MLVSTANYKVLFNHLSIWQSYALQQSHNLWFCLTVQPPVNCWWNSKMCTHDVMVSGSTTASLTAGMKNFPWKGRGLAHVIPFKNFKLPLIFLEWMKVHSLNLVDRLPQVPPSGKKFPPERGVAGSRDRFGDERSLNFANASNMASATQGLKIPTKRVWCPSCDRCLNFNHFNISGGMKWGREGNRWRRRAGYHAS